MNYYEGMYFKIHILYMGINCIITCIQTLFSEWNIYFYWSIILTNHNSYC